MTLIQRLKEVIYQYLSTFREPERQLSSRQKWVLGLINLSSVVIFWVLSSFLVNDLFETDIYRKPFFITYLNTACFSFYLIPYMKYNNVSASDFIRRLKADYGKGYMKLDTEDRGESNIDYGSNDDLTNLETEYTSRLESAKYDDIGLYESVKLSLQFIMLWFSANLVTNSSLSYTSVASQTILSSTSSFFTLIIGFMYSIEKINQNKIVGILLSFTGVLIITKIDTSSNNPSDSNTAILAGNLLALSGALIYGIYTILLKFKITIKNSIRERNLDTHLFFGFVGVFNTFLLWPIIIILHFTDIERFELPSNNRTISLLLTNALITFISDFCWCKAVLLTSPLTVTVGLSMTIPLAMVGDWILKGFSVNWWYLFGAFIVTVGFLVINKDEKDDFVTNRETHEEIQ
ncbi:DEHA2D01606p [Debaryomyces hansenii CBS767]|uniref:DEHA2D01606p n=1 Tax=Debaryomyces hansenii (strain ATCC 36239 / CBS 767 / BCRC 21394 / JCM 1990 / NBRC 0083 / IGC 2968) TaxID=284592 RepID=Q6BTD2_DEBHA|nr:DEHA2D01606p [Debaryomyces hansenii CBS767]CAG86670.2 DEHA2D01606p [Debaryomyces hansenii CBS767]|eukprot:XP_458538.2 DEHA2D01606p [Debaryomyces hansenii CBS767]